MGYVLVFLPIVLSKTKLFRYRFIFSFLSEFVLTVLLLLNVNVWYPFSLARAIAITAYGFLPLIFCTVVCLFDFDGFLKAGICTLFTAVIFYFTNYVAGLLFGATGNQYQVDFNDWERCINGNIYLLCLLALSLLGAAFIAVGIARSNKLHRK